MTPTAISVSIINYRTAELTLDCLRSVLPQLGAVGGEVAIVDNASGDGSADAIADWIAGHAADAPVRLVRSSDNTGFSGGHNQGIAATTGDWVLVLNSDAILRPDFLRSILATAHAHPRAGFIAPRLEDADGTPQISRFRFASPLSELIRGAATGPVTALFKSRVVALPPDAPDDDIDWASFACILLNRRMIDAIGPMDEGYFLYFEDAEYCLRARRAGWRIVTADAARAVHYRGGSGPVKALQKARKRMPPYFYASRSRFLRQAHGHAGLIAANLLWHAGRGIARLRMLAGRPVPRAAEREARDIWINARDPLGPRRAPGD